MRYPVSLIPAGKIARPVNVGLRMRKLELAPATVERIEAEAVVAAHPVVFSKSPSPSNPVIGSNVTFIINVTNEGTRDATNVVVTDPLPDGYLFVSATPNYGSYLDGVWTLGDLPAESGTKILLIVATVLAAGERENVATLGYSYPADEQDVASTPVEEPTPEIPAGSDVWYESPNASVIPFQEYGDAVSGLTDATAFGEDDDDAFEGDLAGIPAAPLASAWWQITTPAGITSASLTVDTWLTTGARLNSAGDGPADYPGDTNLSIWTTAEAPPLGALPTASTDFDTMTLVASSDDDPDPSDSTRQYTSKLENVTLAPDKVYWIRVDTWGSPTMNADGIVYRIRVSLTITP